MDDSASASKAELMGALAEQMRSLAGVAASLAERTQRASTLAIQARECAELYGGMFKAEPRPDEAYAQRAPIDTDAE